MVRSIANALFNLLRKPHIAPFHVVPMTAAIGLEPKSILIELHKMPELEDWRGASEWYRSEESKHTEAQALFDVLLSALPAGTMDHFVELYIERYGHWIRKH